MSLPNKTPQVPGDWKELYQLAMLELDYGSLPGRIAAARHAILDRAEDIQTNPSTDERRALGNALRTLELLEDVVTRGRKAS